ncbi:hypothetical protein MIR68_008046 [Amoeboaphelidium protococcarum]|nr:hypothetical protein MIR68_008046 [Amoeboaphelidium protococcarum]
MDRNEKLGKKEFSTSPQKDEYGSNQGQLGNSEDSARKQTRQKSVEIPLRKHAFQSVKQTFAAIGGSIRNKSQQSPSYSSSAGTLKRYSQTALEDRHNSDVGGAAVGNQDDSSGVAVHEIQRNVGDSHSTNLQSSIIDSNTISDQSSVRAVLNLPMSPSTPTLPESGSTLSSYPEEFQARNKVQPLTMPPVVADNRPAWLQTQSETSSPTVDIGQPLSDGRIRSVPIPSGLRRASRGSNNSNFSDVDSIESPSHRHLNSPAAMISRPTSGMSVRSFIQNSTSIGSLQQYASNNGSRGVYLRPNLGTAGSIEDNQKDWSQSSPVSRSRNKTPEPGWESSSPAPPHTISVGNSRSNSRRASLILPSVSQLPNVDESPTMDRKQISAQMQDDDRSVVDPSMKSTSSSGKSRSRNRALTVLSSTSPLQDIKDQLDDQTAGGGTVSRWRSSSFSAQSDSFKTLLSEKKKEQLELNKLITDHSIQQKSISPSRQHVNQSFDDAVISSPSLSLRALKGFNSPQVPQDPKSPPQFLSTLPTFNHLKVKIADSQSSQQSSSTTDSPNPTLALKDQRSLSDGDMNDYLKGFSELKDYLKIAKVACNNEIQHIIFALNGDVERSLTSSQVDLLSSRASSMLESLPAQSQGSLASNDVLSGAGPIAEQQLESQRWASSQSMISSSAECDVALPFAAELTSFAQDIIDLSLSQLISPGTCQKFIAEAQSLQKRVEEAQLANPLPAFAILKRHITRLLLAFSPVARLVEHLEIDARGFHFFLKSSSAARGGKGQRKKKSGSRRGSIASPSAPVVDKDGEGKRFKVAWNYAQEVVRASRDDHRRHYSELESELDKLNAMSVLMEWNVDGTIRYITPSCKSVFGFDVEELLGNNGSKILDPRDATVWSEANALLLSVPDHFVEINYRCVRPDGQILLMEARGLAITEKQTECVTHTMWVTRTKGKRNQTSQSSLANRASAPYKNFSNARHLSQTNYSEWSETDDSAMEQGSVGTRGIPRSEISFDGQLISPGTSYDDAVLCRICERSVPVVRFEEHSDLCSQIHRAELQIQTCNDELREVRRLLIGKLNQVVSQQSLVGDCDIKSLQQQKKSSSDSEIVQPGSALKQLLLDMLIVVDDIYSTRSVADELESSPVGITPLSPSSQSSLNDDFPAKKLRLVAWRGPSLNECDDAKVVTAGAALVSLIREKLSGLDKVARTFEQFSATYDAVYLYDDEEVPVLDFESDSNSNSSSNPAAVAGGNYSGSLLQQQFQQQQRKIQLKLDPSRTNIKSPLSKTFDVESIPSPNVEQFRYPTFLGGVGINSGGNGGSGQYVRKMSIESANGANIGASERRPFMSRDRSLSLTLNNDRPNSPGSVQSHGSGSIASSLHTQPRLAPSIKDFDIIKPISKGAFGSVYLAKKRTTGEYYAIKVLRKADMIAKNQVMNVKAEKMILSRIDSPYVVKLFYSFQSRDNLYLVMEYLNGGDCSALVKAMGALDEEWAKRYVSEVVQALEYLHQRNIIHRDLKPENLLIDQNGHLKLTDFGLSKVGFLGRRAKDDAVSLKSAHSLANKHSQEDLKKQSTQVPSSTSLQKFPENESNATGNNNKLLNKLLLHDPAKVSMKGRRESLLSLTSLLTENNNTSGAHKSFVGTPDYLAPESILGVGQDAGVDWWALGVILYEFLFGYPPFHAETPLLVFENILARNLHFPSDEEDAEIQISAEARDLICRLLQSDPRTRLGSHKDAGEVKKHKFFYRVDFLNLNKTEPQFVPQVEKEDDTSYFEARGADEMLMDDTDDVNVADSGSRFSPGSAIARELPSDIESASLESPNTLSTPRTSRQNSVLKSRSQFLHKDSSFGQSLMIQDDGQTDFGSFVYKNLSVLEKANLEVLKKLKLEGKTSPGSEFTGQKSRSRSFMSIKSAGGGAQRNLSLPSATDPSNTLAINVATQRVKKSQSEIRSTSASGVPKSFTAGAVSELSYQHPPVHINLERRSSTHQQKPNKLRTPIVHSPTIISSQINEYFGDDTHMLHDRTSLPYSDEHLNLPTMSNAAKSTQSSMSEDFSEDQQGQFVQKQNQSAAESSGVQLSPPTQNRSEAPKSVQTSPPSTGQSDGRQKKSTQHTALIADDNPISSKILDHILKRNFSFDCVVVRNGAEAIRCAMGDIKFDVIFMDIRMPIIDGETASQMIKSASSTNSSTPIVAVTAYEMEDEFIKQQKDLESPFFDDILAKPVTLEMIKKVMLKVCGLSHLSAKTSNSVQQ